MSGDRWRIVMEQRDGGTLERALDDQGSLHWARFWLRELARSRRGRVDGREYIAGRIVNPRGVVVEWWNDPNK